MEPQTWQRGCGSAAPANPLRSRCPEGSALQGEGAARDPFILTGSWSRFSEPFPLPQMLSLPHRTHSEQPCFHCPGPGDISYPHTYTPVSLPSSSHLPRPHPGVTPMGMRRTGSWSVGKGPQGPAAVPLSEDRDLSHHTRTRRNLSGKSPSKRVHEGKAIERRSGPGRAQTGSPRTPREKASARPRERLVSVPDRASLEAAEHEERHTSPPQANPTEGGGCQRVSPCSGSARKQLGPVGAGEKPKPPAHAREQGNYPESCSQATTEPYKVPKVPVTRRLHSAVPQASTRQGQEEATALRCPEAGRHRRRCPGNPDVCNRNVRQMYPKVTWVGGLVRRTATVKLEERAPESQQVLGPADATPFGELMGSLHQTLRYKVTDSPSCHPTAL